MTLTDVAAGAARWLAVRTVVSAVLKLALAGLLVGFVVNGLPTVEVVVSIG